MRQPLGDEIHAPTLIRACCQTLRNTLPLSPLFAFLSAHHQSFFRVQSIDPFGIHRPAFPLQQHRQPSIAVAHPAAGQLTQSHPQRLLGIAMMFVAQSHAMDRNQPRCPPLAQLVSLFGPLRQLAPLSRP